MWRGSSATASRLTLDTYGHVMDELDDAPRLAAVDAIMQARSGPPPERPGLTVSSACCPLPGHTAPCRRTAVVGPRCPRFESWIAHPPEFRNSLHLHDVLDFWLRVSQMVWVLRGAIWGHQLVACDEKRSWVRAAVKVGAGSENAVGAS